MKDGEIKILSQLKKLAANKFFAYVGKLSDEEHASLDDFLTKTDNVPLRYVEFFLFYFFCSNLIDYSNAIDWATYTGNNQMDCNLFAVHMAKDLGYDTTEAQMMASGAVSSPQSNTKNNNNNAPANATVSATSTTSQTSPKESSRKGMYLVSYVLFVVFFFSSNFNYR